MYESFYHLREKPFHLSPDPRFFFGSSGHKRVLAYLRYGVHEGEGFIIVTGEVGAGKTTLVYMLLEELGNQKDIVVAHLVTPQPDMDDLLPTIAIHFGLYQEGLSKAALQHRLEEFLIRQAREGKRVLLIVDEAQSLSLPALEGLRLLTNYQLNRKVLLQGFLLGQAEFRDTLSSGRLEQLRQRVAASYHLGPMDFDETRQYIGHRLSIAGWSGDPTFTPPAYEAIYDYTGGIPRRINSLCDRLLLVGFLEEAHEINGELVNTVIQELNEESFGMRRGVRSPKPVAPAERHTENALPLTDALSNIPSHPEEQRLADLQERLTAVEEAIARARDLTAFRPEAKPDFTAERLSRLANDSGQQRLTDIERRLAVLEEDMAARQDSPEPFVDRFERSGPGEPPPSQTAFPASSQARVTVIRRLSYLVILALVVWSGWLGLDRFSLPSKSPSVASTEPAAAPEQLSNNRQAPTNQDASPVASDLPAALPASAPGEANEPVPDGTLPAAEQAVAGRADSSLQAIPASADGQQGATVDSAPPPLFQEVHQPSGEERTVAPPADGVARLTLEFLADCWVDVKDADGQRLAYGVMKGDTTQTISGVTPFSLTLGNPAAVRRISLNGETVDKQMYLPKAGRVSRFSLPSKSPSVASTEPAAAPEQLSNNRQAPTNQDASPVASDLPAALPASAPGEANEPVPDGTLPAAEQAVAGGADSSLQATPASADGQQGATVDSDPPPLFQEVHQPSGEERTVAPPADGVAQLTLEFLADCWVDVKDADGQRLAYGVMKGDTTQTLSGVTPFSLTLGNPAAVRRISLNGETVDKQTYLPKAGRVSRFVLP